MIETDGTGTVERGDRLAVSVGADANEGRVFSTRATARLNRLRQDNEARLPGRGAPEPTATYARVVVVDDSFWRGGRY